MEPGTSKIDFEGLAELRLREARCLVAGNEFDGARCLAGYAVECALKAVILKNFPAHTLLPPNVVKEVHVHNLAALLKLAQLEGALKESQAHLVSWTVVKDWSEQLRYASGCKRISAEGFLDAIDSTINGVLPWVKQRW